MELVNSKYYIGFEGEPEIQFIYKKEDNIDILVIWEGYFDQIMRSILPGEQGWTSLAYHYNMYTGWYIESPWRIEDLQMALEQFKTIDDHELCDESAEILKLLCCLLNQAIENNGEICVVRE